MPSSHNILIIDNNDIDRLILQRFLCDCPEWESADAITGESALHQIEAGDIKPDCLLVDYYLSDMTGLEFLAELECRNLFENFDIVMMVGTGDEVIASESIKRGALACLNKSYITPDNLKKTLDAVISSEDSK